MNLDRWATIVSEGGDVLPSTGDFSAVKVTPSQRSADQLASRKK